MGEGLYGSSSRWIFAVFVEAPGASTALKQSKQDHPYVYRCLYMYMYRCASTCMRMGVYMYVYTMCMYMSTYMCMHVCIYTHMYVLQHLHSLMDSIPHVTDQMLVSPTKHLLLSVCLLGNAPCQTPVSPNAPKHPHVNVFLSSLRRQRSACFN